MTLMDAIGRAFAPREDAFSRVGRLFSSLPYMDEKAADVMRDIIKQNDARDILELGFFHGKSSAYIAAILDDFGRGHLTTLDKANARDRNPSIAEVLSTAALGHRVTPIFAESSFIWELGKMLQQNREPRFDLAYIDGGHTWHTTGFAFLLVDLLLRPGGIVVFDDLDWTEATSPARLKKNVAPKETHEVKQVRMVFDLLVRSRGYTGLKEIAATGWGIARKP